MASIFHIPSGVFPDGITFGDGTKQTTASTGGGGGGGSTTLDNTYPPTSSSTTSAPTSLVAKQIYQTASGALPLSGGTMTGTLTLSSTSSPIVGDASGLDLTKNTIIGSAANTLLIGASGCPTVHVGTNGGAAPSGGTVNIGTAGQSAVNTVNLGNVILAGRPVVNIGTGTTTSGTPPQVNIGNTTGTTTAVSIGNASSGSVTIQGQAYTTPDKASNFGTNLGTTTGVTLGTLTTTTKTTIYGLEDTSPLNAAYLGLSSTSNAPTINNLNKTNAAVTELQTVVGQLAGLTIGGGTLVTAGTVASLLTSGATSSSALQKSSLIDLTTNEPTSTSTSTTYTANAIKNIYNYLKPSTSANFGTAAASTSTVGNASQATNVVGSAITIGQTGGTVTFQGTVSGVSGGPLVDVATGVAPTSTSATSASTANALTNVYNLLRTSASTTVSGMIQLTDLAASTAPTSSLTTTTYTANGIKNMYNYILTQIPNLLSSVNFGTTATSASTLGNSTQATNVVGNAITIGQTGGTVTFQGTVSGVSGGPLVDVASGVAPTSTSATSASTANALTNVYNLLRTSASTTVSGMIQLTDLAASTAPTSSLTTTTYTANGIKNMYNYILTQIPNLLTSGNFGTTASGTVTFGSPTQTVAIGNGFGTSSQQGTINIGNLSSTAINSGSTIRIGDQTVTNTNGSSYPVVTIGCSPQNGGVYTGSAGSTTAIYGSTLTIGNSQSPITFQGKLNPMNMSFALSDESTTLTSTNSVSFRTPFGFAINTATFMVGNLGSSGTIVFDILVNNSSIVPTYKPQIAYTATQSVGANFTNYGSGNVIGTFSAQVVNQYDLITIKVHSSSTQVGMTGAKCFINYY